MWLTSSHARLSRSRCWHARSRTRYGTVSKWPTSAFAPAGVLPGRPAGVSASGQRWARRADARAILAVAPTPSQVAKLTGSQLRAALKRSGRSRDFDTAIDRIQAVFRADYLRQRPQVEAAMGHQMLALLRQLDAACVAADDLAAATIAEFDKHPDAKILLSFSGLGPLTAARVLAEIGDDRTRFIDARALSLCRRLAGHSRQR
jgi:transposase